MLLYYYSARKYQYSEPFGRKVQRKKREVALILVMLKILPGLTVIIDAVARP